MKHISICFLLAFLVGSANAATLTVTTITETAAAITAASADTTNGDVVPNANADVMLYLENTDGADSATVTITAQNTSTTKTGYGTLTKSDNTISLSASQAKWVGPFPATAYNNSSDQIELSYSGAASTAVEVTAFKGDGLRATQ